MQELSTYYMQNRNGDKRPIYLSSTRAYSLSTHKDHYRPYLYSNDRMKRVRRWVGKTTSLFLSPLPYLRCFPEENNAPPLSLMKHHRAKPAYGPAAPLYPTKRQVPNSALKHVRGRPWDRDYCQPGASKQESTTYGCDVRQRAQVNCRKAAAVT